MPALPRVDRLKTIYSAAKALNDGYTVYGVPALPKLTGGTRCVPALHRMVIRFDPLAEGSAGARTFIKEELIRIARSTPSVSFYTLPGRQNQVVVTGEYAQGKQVKYVVDGSSAADVRRFAVALIARAGDPVTKNTIRQTSRVPSLQGEWTPAFRKREKILYTPPATLHFKDTLEH